MTKIGLKGSLQNLPQNHWKSHTLLDPNNYKPRLNLTDLTGQLWSILGMLSSLLSLHGRSSSFVGVRLEDAWRKSCCSNSIKSNRSNRLNRSNKSNQAKTLWYVANCCDTLWWCVSVCQSVCIMLYRAIKAQLVLLVTKALTCLDK
jgi:hypothetical protein